MHYQTVHLLDLPDEILLIIMKKLGPIDVLYSLLDTNERLSPMVKSINNTKVLDFSIVLSDGEFSSIDDLKLNRFCDEILPQIHHNVVSLTLDLYSMERILFPWRYPNLSVITFANFSPDIILRHLTGKEYSFIIIIIIIII